MVVGGKFLVRVALVLFRFGKCLKEALYVLAEYELISNHAGCVCVWGCF